MAVRPLSPIPRPAKWSPRRAENGRILPLRPRDGDALAPADHGVTIGQAPDQIVGMGGPRRFDDVLFACTDLAIGGVSTVARSSASGESEMFLDVKDAANLIRRYRSTARCQVDAAEALRWPERPADMAQESSDHGDLASDSQMRPEANGPDPRDSPHDITTAS
jgi:hypothetical protein